METEQTGNRFRFANESDEPLSVREAASESGATERVILRAIARGDLPASRNGRAYAISRTDFSQFLERHPFRGSLSPLQPALRLIPFRRLELPEAPAFRLPRSELIGRDREFAELQSLLRRDDVPLVTVTGPGGVGKTRLALAVAQSVSASFPDGVWMVALAQIRDARLVAHAIATTLGIREEASSTLLDQLIRFFANRRSLLLLDNFEQVIEAATLIAHLIESCPGLTLLVSSRSRIRLNDEHEYLLPPLELTLPESPAAGMPIAPAAARLFVARASAVQHDFAWSEQNSGVIVAICRKLDGLPLAIELAAPHAKTLPLKELLIRLEQRLPQLTLGNRDSPARQQTMRDTIAWSYNLLSSDQQSLFRLLSVFVGSFSLDAIESLVGNRSNPVATIEGVGALLEASLLRRLAWHGASARYSMLETVREFGLEQLGAAGEAGTARDAHARYFVELDWQLDPNYVPKGEQFDDCLDRVEADHPNIQAALGHLASIGDNDRLLRLTGVLALFWHHRGHLSEGQQWLERGLANSTGSPADHRARALAGLSLIVWSQGEIRRASSLAYVSRSTAEQTGTEQVRALATHMLALVALSRNQLKRAAVLMESAFGQWSALGIRPSEAMALMVLSGIAFLTGDVDRSRRLAEASLPLFRDLGHSSGTASATGRLAQLAHHQGDDRRAAVLYQEVLGLLGSMDERWVTTISLNPAHEPAADTITEPLFPRWASIDNERSLIHSLHGLARIAASHDQPDQAALLLGAIDVRIPAAASLITPTLRTLHEHAVEQAREALGPDRYSELHARGRELPLSSLVSIAADIDVPETRKLAPPAPPQHGLTPRETEVLGFLVEGASNAQIGDALFISHRTARAHVASILAKLGVPTRTAASTLAIRQRLV